MKKSLEYILTITLLFCLLPMNVSAQENNVERTELLEKACVAFPEYADIINADTVPSTVSRSVSSREVVFSETRDISETEFIVYTEYSDGLVVLDSVEIMDDEVDYNSTEQSGSMTKFDITVTATCLGVNSYFTLSNVKFTIYATTYDRITSSGTPTTHNVQNTYNDKCTNWDPVCTPNETASAAAKISVKLQFRFGPRDTEFYISYLTINIRNNQLTVEHKEYKGG